ncbi:MAG: hypothetical protein CBE26_00720 [Kiritimatiellaceae bacterium TMED266]|nr:MAG: hypothetical protein CBE26_00720 [Kiritimatiellaceae bacterium TMED266]
MRLLYGLLISIILCSGCTMLKPNAPPIQELPETFSAPALTNSVVADEAWWQTFENAELNQLIYQALTNSPTLDQAWARLRQAEATATRLGAARLPSIDLTASGSRTEALNQGADSERYTAGAAASFELDLWGRVNAVQMAAAIDAIGARDAVETAAISLTAEVASRWHQLIARRLERNILEQQLRDNKTSLELIELRFRKSLSTGLAVLQQRQTVEATAALLPLAERAEHAAALELARLLGQTETVALTTTQLLSLPPLPTLGIPANLLEQRPDVRRARNALDAAGWRVAASRAERLPAIRLTGRIESTEPTAEALFDDWFSTLAGSLTSPLFNAGASRATIRQSEAVMRERFAAYRAAIINAVQEVEQALNLERTQAAYADAVAVRLHAAQQAYDEAVSRYRNGAVEYTTVLFQLNTLQQLERTQISAQADQVAYRIALFRVLGGNWTAELVDSGE